MKKNIKLKELIIKEIKLSRVYRYIQDDKFSFGIISASRHEYSDEENKNRLKSLIADVRKLGYGYIHLEGGYIEDGLPVRERSLLIPSIKKDELLKLGEKYEQNGVLYKDKNQFVEYSTNKIDGVGKVLTSFKFKSGKDNFTMSKDIIKNYYSKLIYGPHSNKKFVFNLNERESSSFNIVAYQKRPLRWIKVF